MPNRDESKITEEILANTIIKSPPLVPEVKLRLLDRTSPWKLSGLSLFSDDGPKPYWAYAWGSGQALARYLLDHPELVRRKRVLDFGAGSGIAAIAAARCRAASVTANDIDPRALAAISLNAQLNDVTVATDTSDFLVFEDADVDVVVVGDAFFNWPGNEAVLRKAKVAELKLVAVPNRRGLAPGRELPRKRLTQLASYDVRTVPQIELEAICQATVYSFQVHDPATHVSP